MADLNYCWEYVVLNEDSTKSGVVAIDNDGGKVRFGVNSKSNPKALAAGFYEMDRDSAFAYARDQVFNPTCFSYLRGSAITDNRVAAKLCDIAFNGGVIQAAKILQRVCNAGGAALSVDGRVGAGTLAACNLAPPEQLLLGLIEALKQFYNQVIAAHPEDEKYRKNWMARAEKVPQ